MPVALYKDALAWPNISIWLNARLLQRRGSHRHRICRWDPDNHNGQELMTMKPCLGTGRTFEHCSTRMGSLAAVVALMWSSPARSVRRATCAWGNALRVPDLQVTIKKIQSKQGNIRVSYALA